MADEFSTDRLMDLICRMCGDDLSPDEFAVLQQALRNDPVARRRYYDFIELHGDLSWTFGKLGTKIPPAVGSACRAELDGEARPHPADGIYNKPQTDCLPAIIVEEARRHGPRTKSGRGRRCSVFLAASSIMPCGRGT